MSPAIVRKQHSSGFKTMADTSANSNFILRAYVEKREIYSTVLTSAIGKFSSSP